MTHPAADTTLENEKKLDFADFAEAAASFALEAFATLKAIVRDPAATAATRLRAVGMVFDRAYGRPRLANPRPVSPPPPGFSFVDGPTPGTEEAWVAQLRARIDAEA